MKAGMPGGRIASGASLAAVLLVLTTAAVPALAQLNPEAPVETDGVDIEQKLDTQVPLDLGFKDENGRPVRLGQYFGHDRPVLLTLVYYRCPMLCSLVLNGMLQSLEQIDWTPGREFDIVTVSIDPTDKPTTARLKKQTYLADYQRAGAEAGWHFLTGKKENIDALADAVGFGYRYIPDSKEYAHPATLIVLTPEGRTSRYLVGLNHAPQTVRLSLVEASAGRIGSVVDQFLLTCFRYDETKGRYAPTARRLMRLGGGVTVVVLGAALIGLWRRDARSKKVN